MENDEVKKLQAAWRIALIGHHGEIIKNDLKFYATKQAHVPNDPYSTAYNDGMRTIATNILTMVEGEENVPHETKVIR